MFISIAAVVLLVIHQGQCGMNATADLYPPYSADKAGTLIFTQDNAYSAVRITGAVTSGQLNPSSAHGFHIHVYPVTETEPNCTAAGPHFNPYNTTHGPFTPNITDRHVGDLGNITADENGSIELDMEDWIIQLYNSTQSIVNRTAVIHALRDDGGEGGFNDSQTTGNAGARIICGLITLTWIDPTTTTITSSTSTPESSTTTTTNTDSSTTTSESSTATSTENSTTTTTTDRPSTGLNIHPAMYILIITIIIHYIICY